MIVIPKTFLLLGRPYYSPPPRFFGVLCILFVLYNTSLLHGQTIPYPDFTAREQPNPSKKVKVFIMMGQSNMVGFGQVEGDDRPGTLRTLTNNGLYPHLVHPTKTGEWEMRMDVWNVWVNNFGLQRSALLSPSMSSTFGPELGFGHVMGYKLDEGVVIIKVGLGNRALGWDFLPPNTPSYNFDGKRYPAHGECPESSIENAIPQTNFTSTYCRNCPSRNQCPIYFTGNTTHESKELCEMCFGWYAGTQFDRDVRNAINTIQNLQNIYPLYNNGQGVEVGGFVWWQGHRDTFTDAHALTYQNNLKSFIREIRIAFQDYGGLNAPFVLGTIGFRGCDDSLWNKNRMSIYNAQIAVSSSEDDDNNFVKTVDTRTFWRDASESPVNNEAHYNHNAETYYEVGNALGWAMSDLILGENNLYEHTC